MRVLRTSPWRLACWLLCLAVTSVAADARATPSKRGDAEAESNEYRQAVRTALEEFDAGNFPEARAAFTRAHALSPNARTYRGLGFVAFELRNYREAVHYLESAIASNEKPLDGELRRTTQELLARARGLLGTVRIEASPGFDSVLVDGLTAELEQGTLVLEVGDHVIEVRAQGMAPERRALQIAGGERLNLTFMLHPAEAEPPVAGPRLQTAADPDAPARNDEPEKRRLYKNPWLWSAVGVVLVGAGVGAYFLLRPDAEVKPEDPTTTRNTPQGGVLQTLRSF